MDRVHYTSGNSSHQYYNYLWKESKNKSISSYPRKHNDVNCTSELSEVDLPQKQLVKMSSQMDAVIRLMTGQETRTIADKLADSNRPTWEQYKKRNEDKLNLTDFDEKKMDDYRKKLDSEREKRLNDGIRRNLKKHTKRKKRLPEFLSYDSDEVSYYGNKLRMKISNHSQKFSNIEKKRRHKNISSDNKEVSDSCYHSYDSYRGHRKRKGKKRKEN